ncbi:MAG TPA: ThuA domain-containing protein, partial [Vicinamibacterales bacterium]
GFVATHAGATAFFSWPEFGDMLGGRFDEHPWGIAEATVVVEDRESPISRHLPASFAVTDEHYQLKEFSRDKVHVLARLDASKLDLKAPLVHRTDRDFVAAYTKTYGKGRVFYSTLGHPRELWDTPWMQKMYFEALKWSMGQ